MIIIAKDDMFSQMLKTELKILGIEAQIKESFDVEDLFAVVDLDFISDIPKGFTVITYSRTGQVCDLERPFYMKDFRSLVKARFFSGADVDRGLIVNDRGVWVGEFSVELSKKEKELLTLLYENRNIPVYEDEIREKIFDGAHGNVIAVYIAYLRRKIDMKYSKKYIYTVRGGGYMLKM